MLGGVARYDATVQSTQFYYAPDTPHALEQRAAVAEQLIGFIAVVLGAANVVGAFVVTDRMLEMFKRKPNQGTEQK